MGGLYEEAKSNARADGRSEPTGHVLESATLLSVLGEDMAAFERSVTQLKTYYGALAAQLPPSPLHYPILGTRLLQLLVENRMAEFHNEVRLRALASLWGEETIE